MADHDSPKNPPTTPVVIDPDVDPKSSTEMEQDGETEGEALGHRTNDSGIDSERPDSGDDSLEAMRSAPLLPPG